MLPRVWLQTDLELIDLDLDFPRADFCGDAEADLESKGRSPFSDTLPLSWTSSLDLLVLCWSPDFVLDLCLRLFDFSPLCFFSLFEYRNHST